MARRKALFEIVGACRQAKTKAGKVKVLRDNASPQLQEVLAYTYNKNINWLLPEGDPPYNPVPDHADLEGTFWGKVRMFQYFVAESGRAPASKTKLEDIFVGVLESVDPNDAKVLLEIKNRNIKGVTVAAVKEAFPDIQGLDG